MALFYRNRWKRTARFRCLAVLRKLTDVFAPLRSCEARPALHSTLPADVCEQASTSRRCHRDKTVINYERWNMAALSLKPIQRLLNYSVVRYRSIFLASKSGRLYWILFSLVTGMVSEQTHQVEEKARGGDGDGQAETRSFGQPDGREQRRHLRHRGRALGQKTEHPVSSRGLVYIESLETRETLVHMV